jgi:Putative Ig domain/Concanavalin A-like lectin/glucanases superfamily
MLLWTSLLDGGGGFPPPLTISGTPELAGVGLAYSFTPTVTGGDPPYSFALQSGTLPDGLSLNSSTGEISGTPTEDGTFAGIVIRVTDGSLSTADLPITMEVAPAATNPTFANVKLLFGFEGADGSTTLTDESGAAHTITGPFNGGEIDTAQFRFGSSSLLLAGGSPPDHYASPDDADFTLGTNDFTLELNVRFSSATPAGPQAMISQWHETTGRRAWGLRLNASEQLEFLYSTSGNNAILVAGAWGPTGNTWYYLAVSRIGSNLYLFVEDPATGIAELVATHNIGASSIHNSITEVRIGALNEALSSAQGLVGWLDEVRLTVGQGLYTESFVAPQSAFPRS